MERTCKKCGKTMPIQMFPKNGGYYKNTCKICTNKYKSEWRKKHPYEKDNLRCALKRERLKAETGRTYRNKKDAERARAYAKRYEAEHKHDAKHKETQSRCQKNYEQRRKIREQVKMFEGFDFNDLEL